MNSFVACVLVTSLSLFAGCSGQSSTFGDQTAPAKGGSLSDVRSPDGYLDGHDEKGCLAVPLYCAGGKDVFVGSQAGCGSYAESCYSRIDQCTGQVLWCAHYSNVSCGNVPVCDPGDRQVSGCPDAGASADAGATSNCYQLGDCHTTIWCQTP